MIGLGFYPEKAFQVTLKTSDSVPALAFGINGHAQAKLESLKNINAS